MDRPRLSASGGPRHTHSLPADPRPPRAARRNLLKTLNDDDYPAAAEPYGSHHHSSHNGGGGAPAAASPPPQGPPHPPGPPDGKAFFRAARARLSPEAYAQLLDNVKGLNARTRTRAQMLAAARQLFGAAHADLYDELERLIDDTLA